MTYAIFKKTVRREGRNTNGKLIPKQRLFYFPYYKDTSGPPFQGRICKKCFSHLPLSFYFTVYSPLLPLFPSISSL